MKKLLILIFSISLLWSPSGFADDISDFQIEGISIGDSLLDYMSEEEILEEIEGNLGNYFFLDEPDKYAEIYMWDNLKTYSDGMSFFIRNTPSSKYLSNKNEKYIILSMRGMISYIEDNDSCIVKRDEIAEVASMMFPNSKKDLYTKAHRGDPSGNSIMYGINYALDSGGWIDLQCVNFEETWRIENNQTEGISIAVDSKEITDWFLNR